MRLSLFLVLMRHAMANGPAGFAWLLDEVLWGRDLARVQIVEPLLEISAARSGSTQLARYIEDDPHVCAPSALQIAVPFLWAWRVLPRFERILDRLAKESWPHEHHERHETDLGRTDTFEVIFLVLHQLGDIFRSISERTFIESFRVDEVTEASRELWENDFLRFLDSIGRKTLVHAGRSSGGAPRRLLIKGHFLLVAEHLAKRYPDARFITMLRASEKRFQSLVNFLRCQSTIAPCPPVPWSWLVKYVCTTEVSYCEKEMRWYQSPEGPLRCIIPFDDYIRDLEGTMRKVYRECLNQDLSPHVPRVHAPRVRTNYSVDRSYEELGMDEEALRKRLENHGRWCRTGTRV
jgi:hypothetical protein